MPYEKLANLTPGINTQKTQLLNMGSWSSSNLVRWQYGLLQKYGGWLRLINEALVGTVRGLHAFEDLSGIAYLATGSDQRLQLYSGNDITDITPIRKTTTGLGSAFSTVINTPDVTITDTSNGVSVGDWVEILVPISVGGLIMLGFYRVTSVTDANDFVVNGGSNATSTETLAGHTPKFTTTMSSSTVTVTFDSYPAVLTEVFTVQVSTAVGGLTIDGDYLIQTIVDSNNFTITAASAASSGANAYENSDQTTINYLLPSGHASDVTMLGWGGGSFGEGTWGIGTSSSLVTSPFRNWYLDNFGQNLVALPTNGTLYAWVPPIAVGNVAAAVSGAPLYGTAMFVAMPQAQVVILGAETGGSQDPLLVRWCDNGDYTTWTATSTDQAGSYRLSKGSRIIGGFQAPQFSMVWTDEDVWTMTYIQQPFIYGFLMIGSGCGLIASKAMTILAGTVYWVSIKGFFVYAGGGGVAPVECPVWDIMFADLDQANSDKTFLGSNSLFNEMMCFFPSISGGSGEIDSYLKFNYLENLWDYGRLVRTAWIDESVFGNPIGVDAAAFLQQHEKGYDADDVAMDSSVESGYFDVANGQLFLFINWLLPDFKFFGTDGTVDITIYAIDTPGDTPRAYGPFTVTSATDYINIRARARQMAIKIESDALGSSWRLGALRYRGGTAGMR